VVDTNCNESCDTSYTLGWKLNVFSATFVGLQHILLHCAWLSLSDTLSTDLFLKCKITYCFV